MTEMHPITLSFSKNENEFLEEYTEKSIKQIRFAFLLGIFLYAIFGILDVWIVPEVKEKVWIVRYAVVCPSFLFSYFLTYTNYFKQFAQLILAANVFLASTGIIVMIFLSPPPGSHLYYAGLILCFTFIYTFFKLRFIYALSVSLILILIYEFLVIWAGDTPLPILINNNFFLLSTNLICASASYFMEFYVRRDFLQRRKIEAEEAKSERLLLNILPKGIAERLKQEDSDLNIQYSKVIVDKFPDVTILFADIVEFSNLSSRVSPEALVVFLSELFSIFDNLAEKHGLEKIKTIGDAYLVVGGLPEQRTDHAEAVARMALEMQEEVAKIEAAKEGWLRIRIGIHTGSVVAGVIGRKKFSYDLWGNTVNVASRMEHYSVAGNILVSEETYRRLRNKYSFIERGEIDVKGKGNMKTYFLTGRKSIDSFSSAETETDERFKISSKSSRKFPSQFEGGNIGPYKLISKLGSGAFGVVWLAERRTKLAATKVALKIPLASDVDLETIQQEADLWVKASGHPNVLPIIEADIYDDQVVIASEYAPDGSLDAWLKKNGGKAPSIEEAIEMTSGILAGLEHLHSQNIIHRDLKPANILLQGGTPRLADFGISRVLKTTDQSSRAAGTPTFMAPEAFDGKRSAQTDIWAAGVIFYLLLSGRLPFPQTDMASLLAAIITRNHEPLPASMPKHLHEIVGKSLERELTHRYKSASEMRRALRELAFQR